MSSLVPLSSSCFHLKLMISGSLHIQLQHSHFQREPIQWTLEYELQTQKNSCERKKCKRVGIWKMMREREREKRKLLRVFSNVIYCHCTISELLLFHVLEETHTLFSLKRTLLYRLNPVVGNIHMRQYILLEIESLFSRGLITKIVMFLNDGWMKHRLKKQTRSTTYGDVRFFGNKNCSVI